MGRILILDGMWNKSLSAVRSFGRKGFYVTAGESTILSTALFSKYCNKRFVYPSPLRSREEFFACLEDELIRGRYDAVFPMELSTQLLITGQRDKFEKYARIPFAGPDITEKVHDKAFLMQYAANNGFDIPMTWFIRCPEELNDISDKVRYPVMIKPRNSSGSRGIMLANGKNELLAAYRMVHKRYEFPIIQDYIPPGGDSYGVGLLLNFSSRVRASFVYRRLRSYPVSGGPSTLRESVKRDDISKIASALLTSLGWKGVAHVEFKIDPRDGRPKLLEINPRFWGSLELAIAAGVDFPYLLYKIAMEDDVAAVEDYKAGIRRRWLIPGDLLHFAANPARSKILKDFLDFRTKDDILSIRDPLPAVGRILSGVGLLFDSEMRKFLFRRDV
jgi:predicted ATP-grasp superfamily ATP-dependent carboligase